MLHVGYFNFCTGIMYLIVVLFMLVCVRVCVEVASLYECCLFSVEIILSLVIAIFSFVIVGMANW